MKSNKPSPLLIGLIATVVLLFALPFTWILLEAYRWAFWLNLGLFFAGLIFLLWENKRALKSRTVAYGTHSVATALLVVSLVGVLNFLAYRHPKKLDLTENKLHTFSEQTVQLLTGLTQDVRATMFTKVVTEGKYRPVLDNYRTLNPKFTYEFVDPDKEPTRAKQAGLTKASDTLHLKVGEKESLVDEVSEEKITNALVKLLKDKQQTLCAIIGHQERNFSDKEEEGYAFTREGIAAQSYQFKEIDLTQDGKIAEDCDAIAIIGPRKAFFPKEAQLIDDYLKQGGRAMIALEYDLSGKENAQELVSILKKWSIQPKSALIVDPISRLAGLDAAVPILVSFSNSHPITKAFQQKRANCFFPFSRPLEILPNPPKGIKVEWLAQTSPQAWGESDSKSLGSGRVRFNPGDVKGPVSAAVAVSGKLDEKAARETRIVVFGSSLFAANKFERLGLNSDLFLNTAGWLLEDENSITIRPKEKRQGFIELTKQEQQIIFWLCVVLVPAFLIVGGVANWWRRRKL